MVFEYLLMGNGMLQVAKFVSDLASGRHGLVAHGCLLFDYHTLTWGQSNDYEITRHLISFFDNTIELR